MEHLNFKLFADPVESQLNKMASRILLRVNIDLDQLWQVYQNAYPERSIIFSLSENIMTVIMIAILSSV